MSQINYALLTQFLLYLKAILPFSIPQNGLNQTARCFQSTLSFKSKAFTLITIFNFFNLMASLTLITMATNSMASPDALYNHRGVSPNGRLLMRNPPMIQHRFPSIQRNPQASNSTTTTTTTFLSKKNGTDLLKKEILANGSSEKNTISKKKTPNDGKIEEMQSTENSKTAKKTIKGFF